MTEHPRTGAQDAPQKGDRRPEAPGAATRRGRSGRPVKALVTGTAGSAPPADTWVEVVGRFTAPQTLPGAEVSVATIAADQIREVDPPRNAYE